MLLIASLALAGEPSDRNMYAWIGDEAAGRLGVEDFDRFFKSAAKVDVTIADRPDANAILAGMDDADILYANTHSGYPKKGAPRMIFQTTGGELSATSIHDHFATAELLPTLVVIDGCSTLAKVDPPVMNIAEALRIGPDSKGRAYIGFDHGVVGMRGDEFFRIFLAKWTQGGTLAQAKDQAIAFFANPPSGQKYLDPRAAEIGKEMIIVGDRELTFATVLEGRKPVPKPATEGDATSGTAAATPTATPTATPATATDGAPPIPPEDEQAAEAAKMAEAAAKEQKPGGIRGLVGCDTTPSPLWLGLAASFLVFCRRRRHGVGYRAR